MKFSNNSHLAYCTNIHPAETWLETWQVLKTHTLAVRDALRSSGELKEGDAYAIGLRLSALATEELLEGDNLTTFKDWLTTENCYVFTINGFPYGAFHDTRVKENVYKPDWTTLARLSYTNDLFTIIAELAPADSGGSVSSLPGSFKEFNADEEEIFQHLYACAEHIEHLAKSTGKDLHLGLEPEPLGHFENTEETIAFFRRFEDWTTAEIKRWELVEQYIGVNYDTCHFALEYNECSHSIGYLIDAGIRISKVHLSNAIEIDPKDPLALEAIKSFIEPTYLHQFMVKMKDGSILRFRDIPEFFESDQSVIEDAEKARIHFHIPLYAEPDKPLGSTRQHASDALEYLWANPKTCPHIEMETYTWAVLPEELQKPIVEQIVEEYRWTLKFV